MGTLDALLQYIADIFQFIGDRFSQTVTQISTFVTSIISQIKLILSDILIQIKAVITDVINTLTSFFQTFINSLKAALQQVVDFVWGLIQPLLNKVTALVADIILEIRSYTAYVANLINDYLNSTYEYIISSIKSFVTPIIDWFKSTAESVKQLVQDVIAGLKAVYEKTVQDITASFTGALDGIKALLAQVDLGFPDIAQAFVKAGEAVGAEILKMGEGITKPLDKILDQLLKPFHELIGEEEVFRVRDALLKSFGPNTLDVKNRADAQETVRKWMPTTTLGLTVFNLFTGPFASLMLYKGIIDANAQVMLQEFATAYHFQLLSPADSTLAMYRGDLTREQAIENIIRQGYSPEDANRLLGNGETVPPIGDLLSMKLRGLIGQVEFESAATRQGLSTDFKAAYEGMAEVIPGVQDLMTMAVKGAFSPEEIGTFRTLEDFPVAIKQWGEKQGLTEEWMKRYWSAHWSLPSPNQGFEMFQRGIIDEATLKVLLKALDITPFWRDQMIQLSYSVLTRVDIRRLHQLGLMTRDDLVKAHKDLGYSPDDAEKLTEFTVELNKGKPGEADEELGRLSRTNVVNFYQDGTITRERAIELLEKIGYTHEAATLFIDTADFEAERLKRNAEIEFIIANVVAGAMNFQEAQDELSKLHLSPTELDRATTKLLRESTKATKLPTVEQGTKMYQSKVISEDQFRDLLRRLGYRAEWANAFIGLSKIPDAKKV